MSTLWRDLRRTLPTMLLRPSRLRLVTALGPRGLTQTARFLLWTVPTASRELAAIRALAEQIPDARLRREALASIDRKAYHVQGGALLGTFLPVERALDYVRIIAPLETIYDYLDNLCDRLEGVPAAAYGTLHEALLDALDPARPLHDHYRNGPHGDDGGYLATLVAAVRERVATLPHLPLVADRLRDVAAFYVELQSLKHLPEGAREAACAAWCDRHRDRFPGFAWWEFAAACGSSLPVFALLFLAAQDATPSPHDVAATFDAYFPFVSVVHIMLDYFVDQAEDRQHRELNFVACYPDLAVATERLARLVAAAAERLRRIPLAAQHEFLLRAMCGFYLSQPKVFEQRLEAESDALLAALG